MDRGRFHKRAVQLVHCAQLFKDLAAMPDRTTEKDCCQAADLMTNAANDLDELIKATPPGCICRRIEHDNYSYLDYAESCLHHRQLYHLSEKLKADYAKAERTLKNEVRLRLITAVLSGTAGANVLNEIYEGDVAYVKRAIAIADETLRLIAREDA